MKEHNQIILATVGMSVILLMADLIIDLMLIVDDIFIHIIAFDFPFFGSLFGFGIWGAVATKRKNEEKMKLKMRIEIHGDIAHRLLNQYAIIQLGIDLLEKTRSFEIHPTIRNAIDESARIVRDMDHKRINAILRDVTL